MGLFINKRVHADLYNEENSMQGSNQDVFRTDTFTQLVEEQRKAFDLVNEKHDELQKQLCKQTRIQADRWSATGLQLDSIIDNQMQHNQFELNVTESINRLNRLNEGLQADLDEKRRLNEEFVAKIETLTLVNNEFSERLEKIDGDQALLLSKMNSQIEQQHLFSETLNEQTKVQSNIAEKLEQQEGMLEKFALQLNFLRSVIFERTHFIADKIDNSFQLTTTYLSKLKDKAKKSE